MNIILASGNEVTDHEVMEGALLMAKGNAGFPIITEDDRRLAIMMFLFMLSEFNDESEVI